MGDELEGRWTLNTKDPVTRFLNLFSKEKAESPNAF